jgi:muramoyltetrapeptide carboxypeptidase
VSPLLTKVLPLFVYPLGAAILAGIVALALMRTRFRRAASALLALALVGLWVAATPLFADWLTARLEAEHPPVPVAEAPGADAIVLLGGIVAQPLPPRLTPDLGDAADRILQAMRLHRAGKAPVIVVSGGYLPWEAGVAPEAELIADLLVELGVPRAALVLETASRNTRENAVNTAEVFRAQGWRTGLLVTSAEHMPRALAAFRAAGLDMTPAPADMRATYPLYESVLDLLPDATALARTTAALKELLGLFVYRWRGWAQEHCLSPSHQTRRRMISEAQRIIAVPAPLLPGEKIRFVSPASTPDRDDLEVSAELLRSWGFRVDFGANAFRKLNYLAGTDEERLADFNSALRDPDVRAIFATRGGKGSYRIADRIDFDAAKRDPKFLVGFSDITILQMALCKNGVAAGIHGALSEEDWHPRTSPAGSSLRELLTTSEDVVLSARADEETSVMTTRGRVNGPLVGGNLDMVATAAGWALPRLDGCILLLEAVNMFLGQVDRQLTMLRKGGFLSGLAGIALGRFTDFKPSGSLTIPTFSASTSANSTCRS